MRRSVVLLALFVAIGGCGGGGPDSDAVPADLEIHYRWNSGASEVGPGYAAYSVSLDASGAAMIGFTVGHPSAEQDTWIETFDVSVEDLSALYANLHEVRLFSRTWTRREPIPGSGRGSSLQVVADGTTYSVPTELADRDEASIIAAVYETIRSLVPETMWEGFEIRRADYLASHE